MPITQVLTRSDELIPAAVEHAQEAPADVGREVELSDLDLEAVLGGLERIHFPDPIESPEA